MKVYTKTGDAGQTGLLGGDRVSKTSLRIAAIGEVDELNAQIGIARTFATETPLDADLLKIQCWLFDLGAELASPPGSKFDAASITQEHNLYLENSMDALDGNLPSLKSFILPGGSGLSAHLHLARSTTRRAERSVLLLHETEPIREDARIFLNRLSDWLFLGSANRKRAFKRPGYGMA